MVRFLTHMRCIQGSLYSEQIELGKWTIFIPSTQIKLSMIFCLFISNFFFENLVHQFQKIIKNNMTHWHQPSTLEDVLLTHVVVVNNSYSVQISIFKRFTWSISKNDQNQIIKTKLLHLWKLKTDCVIFYHLFCICKL